MSINLLPHGSVGEPKVPKTVSVAFVQEHWSQQMAISPEIELYWEPSEIHRFAGETNNPGKRPSHGYETSLAFHRTVQSLIVQARQVVVESCPCDGVARVGRIGLMHASEPVVDAVSRCES